MISMTEDDFEVQWYSGTGKGGQHRNKHQNCCRIIHKETGLMATGSENRSRVQNQNAAFQRLALKLIAHYDVPEERRHSNEIVRTYHVEDDRVIDHPSGLRADVGSVLNGDIDRFIANRDEDAELPKTGRVR